jgi:hypothetical protein
MDKIGPSPFSWLEFDAAGSLKDAGAAAAVEAMLNAPEITDFVVLSHGWNNTKADAMTLYKTLWGNVAGALKRTNPARIAVVGVVWPAKAFSTDFDDAAAVANAAGQTLSVGNGDGGADLDEARFEATIKGVEELFGADSAPIVSAARDAALGIDFNTASAFFPAASRAVTAPPGDQELQQNAAMFTPDARGVSPEVALGRLMPPPQMSAAPGLGHVSGLADTIGGIFNGPRAAVARALNVLTYYEMKTRAGIVGAALGGRILPGLHVSAGKRLHLVGHSFGARLVTAAASALPARTPLPLFSLTLLQGAFSHNGLSTEASGAFANAIGRPSGPIAITHTHNDHACTYWYALASRLSNDATQGFGDADDIFGAMGANGAQKLAAGTIVHDTTGQAFAPQRGKVNGFLADGYVVEIPGVIDAHNNVTNSTCGKLVAAVLEV